jgi:hypothetical protein
LNLYLEVIAEITVTGLASPTQLTTQGNQGNQRNQRNQRNQFIVL